MHATQFKPSVIAYLVLVLCLALGGCQATATTAPLHPQGGYASAQLEREALLQRAWRGKKYAELLKSHGEPTMKMAIPGRNATLTYVAVYGMKDKAADCFDAYTVLDKGAGDEALVSDFYCR